MAERRKPAENCSLCLHGFQTPKALPCLHSFCLGCLQMYLDEEDSKCPTPLEKFECPLCRTVVRVRTEIPVADWAKFFPTNFYLADAGDGRVRKEAAMKSGTAEEAEDRTTCGEHDESIKLLCENCDQLICQFCLITKHKSCERVVSLRDAASARRDDIRSKEDGLRKRMKDAEESETKLNKNKKHLTRCKEVIRNELDRAVKEIERQLRKQEELILSDLEIIHMEEQEVLDIFIKECQEEQSSLAAQLEYLNMITGLNDSDLLALYRMLNEFQVHRENWLPDCALPRSIVFQPNEDFLISVRNASNVSPGNLHVCASKTTQVSEEEEAATAPRLTTECQSVLDTWRKKCQPAMISKFCSTTAEGRDRSWIYDVTFLPGGSFVMTDFGCDEVRKFSATGSLLGTMNVVNPRGVSVWSDSEVVVTKETGMGFILHRDRMKMRRVRTEATYYGVCVSPDWTLVCSAPELRPPAVDVISPVGDLLSRISGDQTQTFIAPSYLCIAGDGHVLVSDFAARSLFCLNLVSGRIKFTFRGQDATCLRRPGGVAADNTGHIYLADSGEDQFKVYKLTSAGDMVNTVLKFDETSVNCNSVCVDDNGHLAVTCANSLRVFRVGC